MAKFRGKQYYMGAWHYVLLDILYAIPVIGLIALIVHAFSDKNENRRHYARSYFARFLLVVILCLIGAGLFYAIAGSEAFTKALNDAQKEWKRLTQGEKTVVTQIVPIQDSGATTPKMGSSPTLTPEKGTVAEATQQP